MLANYPQDPLNLMPVVPPARPRVLLNDRDRARCRDFARRLPWARHAYATVLREADAAALPEYSATRPPLELGRGTDFLSLAIAAALEENEVRARQVVTFLHGIAQQYHHWLPHPDGSRILDNLHIEKMLIGNLAAAYDLCVDLAGVSAPVQETIAHELFRPAVEEILWHPVHMMCGNHHLAAIIGSLAVGGAINEPRYLHDAFYGHAYGDGLHSSGIAHQLSHDFLNDGLYWERAPGYHFYSLYCIARFAWIAERLGANLWHRAWPATTEPANPEEEHHDFDARGDKFLQDFFLAPLYMAHSDGSIATVGDSSLAHISQIAAWGPLYESAWEHYGDERFAWMLTQTYSQIQKRQGVDYQPRGSGDPGYIGMHNFVFVEREELPPGRFDLALNTQFCLTGRHENGNTLFPSTGFAVLRSDAVDPQANNVMLSYGPHHAGHQHPDLLSFVWQCDGVTKLLDPLMNRLEQPLQGHFEQPLHGQWHKQTVAHNTVVVDGISHRPQGESSEAYEIDRTPDAARGQLLAFAPRPSVKVVAAETTNAYEFPVRLRRLLLVTADYVLDHFECFGSDEHRWDYMLHPSSEVSEAAATVALESEDGALGAAPGARLVRMLRRAAVPPSGILLTWERCGAWMCGAAPTQLRIGTGPALPGESGVTLALTQHGTRAEYRALFYRASLGIQVRSEAEQLILTTAAFTDTIRFAETGVLWRRSTADGVSEEAVTLATGAAL